MLFLPGKLSRKLLFCNLNQAARDVAPDSSGIPRDHAAVVTILRHGNTQFLAGFKLQLVQSGARLLDDELI